ncbi:cation:proton antiporter [Halomarina pelagica]|uniref:cation:proton antiporter n=1 Tax=Halomarina pelagica TaxID=2961599 RepID=UPI0020C440FB|nr:cation:proton antiporter [Halomarina sp. BND7]
MAGALLLEVGIALVTLALVGALAHRFRQSVIPGYIAAGILVGPYVPTEIGGISLRLVGNSEFVSTVGELGIILLLFFLGLEFNVGTLVANKTRLAKLGGLDLVLNGIMGVLIGYVFGFGVTGIILITGIVYISSSAIITKSLTDAGWLANPESDVILSTLVVEDIVIAVYLAVVSALVLGGGTFAEATMTVVQAFVFLAALAAVAYLGTDYIERIFDVGPDELFVLRIVGVAVLIGAIALSIGVSEAVAAFFVGTAFSETDLIERIEHLVTPLRDIFAAVFFFSIGLSTDLRVVAGVALLLLVAVILTTGTKLISGYASGRVYGLSTLRSTRVGMGLVARGEFSLIIATLASTSAIPVIRNTVPAFAVGYVLVMSLLGTLLIEYEDTISSVLGISP